MSKSNKRTSWYIAGLHFECQQCGECCGGPEEGYIWVTKPEIELIAEFLDLATGELVKKYLKRVSFRTSIIEHPVTKDCIFLDCTAGEKKCKIYPVRPDQCRNWPFWPSNLQGPNDWNRAAQRCPGINRGRLYDYDEIVKIRNMKHWWKMTADPQLIEEMRKLYDWLDSAVAELNGNCKACGRCCDFAAYDHRLFITPPELIYFAHHLAPAGLKPMPAGTCPYRTDSKCTVYNFRFTACRIFHCTANADRQSQLTEKTLKKLKEICKKFDLKYQYTELPKALT